MRISALLAAFALTTCAVACVGDDPTVPTDAGSLSDASVTDAAASDAGPVSSFLCGQGSARISCKLGDFCCLANDGKPTCSAAACAPGTTGLKPACATSADCPGKVCCGENDGVTFLSFSCKDKAACLNAGSRVACQVDRDDCVSGTSCSLPSGTGYGFGICQ